MSFYDALSDLVLQIDSYRLEGLLRRVPGLDRRTTVVRLSGLGEEGTGEDVTYHGGDQRRFQRNGGNLPIAGRFRLAEFSERLGRLELFDHQPDQPASHNYRRWAFESAALDLALRQNGRSLHAVLGLVPQPVRFVVSPGLRSLPELDPLPGFLEHCPGVGFKLDATRFWTAEIVARLAATSAVEVVDLKGAYRGTPVDSEPDTRLYRRVAEGFGEAWIEDPTLNRETEAVLDAHRDRITWDAPIHSIEDIESLPFSPRMLNIKPSRFGCLRSLLATYEYCRARGIETYGGGQFELGPGRGQIQYLASLFHPSAPNDVSPTVYHDADPRHGLPLPPIEPKPRATGFEWFEPKPPGPVSPGGRIDE